MVVPFYHSGMGRILPMHSFIPRAGNVLEIAIGERCNDVLSD